MSPSAKLRNSTVALATIVCSYVFTAFAILSIVIHISKRFMVFRRAELEDYLILIAFTFALTLVVQTTWLVFDEGQGQHMSNVTRSQFEILGKVKLITAVLSCMLRESVANLCLPD